MAKKRVSAIELARAGSSQVQRMAGGPRPNKEKDVAANETPNMAVTAESAVPGTAQETGSTASVGKVVEEQVAPAPSDATPMPDESPVTRVDDAATKANLEPHNEAPESEEKLYWLPLEHIHVGGINTRVIDEESRAFKELVESIQQDGQLEPVLVGREGEGYRLIAGERRYRAARAAGLTTVLARITNAPPEDWAGLMLVENLMRQDLSVWEEAAGYKALLAMGLTLEKVGARVHKGKTHVSLILKIMRNPTIVAAVEEGTITSESMAKELAALIDDEGREVIPGSLGKALEFVVNRGPTVHQLRAWIRTFNAGLQGEERRAGRRNNVRRGTLLKTEQMRLEAMLEKSSEMSSVEIAFLASIY